MKNSIIKLLLAGASALVGLGFATSAQAVLAGPTAPYAVYSFSGDCVDCAQRVEQEAYGVSGSLTLQSFVPGGAVTAANLYSLSYEGSNLFSAFTVFGTDVVNFVASDTFHANGSSAVNFFARFETEIDGQMEQVFFETKADGSFRLGFGDGQIFDNDFGNAATWTLTQTVNPNNVPEPGSMLLMGLALVAVGVARRRRH